MNRKVVENQTWAVSKIQDCKLAEEIGPARKSAEHNINRQASEASASEFYLQAQTLLGSRDISRIGSLSSSIQHMAHTRFFKRRARRSPLHEVRSNTGLFSSGLQNPRSSSTHLLSHYLQSPSDQRRRLKKLCLQVSEPM